VTTHADLDRDVQRMEAKYYELSTKGRGRRRGYLRRAWVLGEMVRYLVTRSRRMPGYACSGAEA